MTDAAQPTPPVDPVLPTAGPASSSVPSPAPSPAPSSDPGSQADSPQDFNLSDDQKIDALNNAIDTAMQPSDPSAPSVLDQALPTAVNQVAQQVNPLNPASPRAASKEVVGGSVAEQSQAETGDSSPIEAGGLQYVEQEPTPEISPEVEAYIKKVEEQKIEAPQEVVIADGTQGSADTNYPSQPVVVLPYSKKTEEEGKKKSPKFSVRWLIEWGQKIVKMFVGRVVYKSEEQPKN